MTENEYLERIRILESQKINPITKIIGIVKSILAVTYILLIYVLYCSYAIEGGLWEYVVNLF